MVLPVVKESGTGFAQGASCGTPRDLRYSRTEQLQQAVLIGNATLD